MCDFGLSKWKTVTENATGDKPSVGPRGTITHIAPEVLRNINCKFTKEIDVYAFAITVWELFAGRIPYKCKYNPIILYPNTRYKKGKEIKKIKKNHNRLTLSQTTNFRLFQTARVCR